MQKESIRDHPVPSTSSTTGKLKPPNTAWRIERSPPSSWFSRELLRAEGPRHGHRGATAHSTFYQRVPPPKIKEASCPREPGWGPHLGIFIKTMGNQKHPEVGAQSNSCGNNSWSRELQNSFLNLRVMSSLGAQMSYSQELHIRYLYYVS